VPPLSIEPFDNTVENKAHPQVHHETKVNPERLMTSRQRQVWHQDEEVEEAAHDYGNQLLEKSSKHALVEHPQQRIRCQKTMEARFSPFALRRCPG